MSARKKNDLRGAVNKLVEYMRRHQLVELPVGAAIKHATRLGKLRLPGYSTVRQAMQEHPDLFWTRRGVVCLTARGQVGGREEPRRSRRRRRSWATACS